MKLLLDTDVLLDVLAEREPFYGDSVRVWEYVERKMAEGWVSAISFNNIYHIVRRVGDRRKARRAIALLHELFQVAPVDTDVIGRAIGAPMRDFEDAIQWACAIAGGIDQIVTRNTRDYPVAYPAAVTPTEFLQMTQDRD